MPSDDVVALVRWLAPRLSQLFGVGFLAANLWVGWQLLAYRRAGRLDQVKMLALTNCTFDGIVYDVERVMEECLAIKPDLVFLWDEAWFAFAGFHPVYRRRTAMAAGSGRPRRALA